jgi:UDP-N-acetylglucosamine 2-epimerase (non-hydrolysing)
MSALTFAVAVIAGTRPERIKIEPVIGALLARGDVEILPCWSGQHALEAGDPRTLVRWRQSPALAHPLDRRTLWRALQNGIAAHLNECTPDAVLVQGDTMTAAAAALTAHRMNLPVVHLEAGLRSGSVRAPFPEEILRRKITGVADLHLTPSRLASDNLRAELISAERIVEVGSTAIDPLVTVAACPAPTRRRDLLVDVHRRENCGAPLRHVAEALIRLADSGLTIGCVSSLNQQWRARWQALVGAHPNITLLPAMCQSLWFDEVRASALVLSDSGAAAEELPYLGVPLLVCRRATERPEPMTTGHARLVTPDSADSIESAVRDGLAASWPAPWPLERSSVYGDGRAAERAATAIAAWLNNLQRAPTAAVEYA